MAKIFKEWVVSAKEELERAFTLLQAEERDTFQDKSFFKWIELQAKDKALVIPAEDTEVIEISDDDEVLTAMQEREAKKMMGEAEVFAAQLKDSWAKVKLEAERVEELSEHESPRPEQETVAPVAEEALGDVDKATLLEIFNQIKGMDPSQLDPNIKEAFDRGFESFGFDPTGEEEPLDDIKIVVAENVLRAGFKPHSRTEATDDQAEFRAQTKAFGKSIDSLTAPEAVDTSLIDHIIPDSIEDAGEGTSGSLLEQAQRNAGVKPGLGLRVPIPEAEDPELAKALGEHSEDPDVEMDKNEPAQPEREESNSGGKSTLYESADERMTGV